MKPQIAVYLFFYVSLLPPTVSVSYYMELFFHSPRNLRPLCSAGEQGGIEVLPPVKEFKYLRVLFTVEGWMEIDSASTVSTFTCLNKSINNRMI